ncbi:MAG: phage tail tube protein [Fusobacteriaceae bacterium]
MAQDRRLRGNEVLTGSYGQMWIDNQKVAEFKEVEAKVAADREDVIIGISKDSKVVSLSGTGSFTLEKVYTRANAILKDWIKGKDKRVKLTFKLEDPDAVGGQIERVTLDNVWFNEIDLAKFSTGAKVGETFTFGFTPEDAEYEDIIK